MESAKFSDANEVEFANTSTRAQTTA